LEEQEQKYQEMKEKKIENEEKKKAERNEDGRRENKQFTHSMGITHSTPHPANFLPTPFY
jgi:hypothetical protein